MTFQGDIGIEYYTQILSLRSSTHWSLVDVNWPNIELAQVLCRFVCLFVCLSCIYSKVYFGPKKGIIRFTGSLV